MILKVETGNLVTAARAGLFDPADFLPPFTSPLHVHSLLPFALLPPVPGSDDSFLSLGILPIGKEFPSGLYGPPRLRENFIRSLHLSLVLDRISSSLCSRALAVFFHLFSIFHGIN